MSGENTSPALNTKETVDQSKQSIDVFLEDQGELDDFQGKILEEEFQKINPQLAERLEKNPTDYKEMNDSIRSFLGDPKMPESEKKVLKDILFYQELEETEQKDSIKLLSESLESKQLKIGLNFLQPFVENELGLKSKPEESASVSLGILQNLLCEWEGKAFANALQGVLQSLTGTISLVSNDKTDSVDVIKSATETAGKISEFSAFESILETVLKPIKNLQEKYKGNENEETLKKYLMNPDFISKLTDGDIDEQIAKYEDPRTEKKNWNKITQELKDNLDQKDALLMQIKEGKESFINFINEHEGVGEMLSGVMELLLKCPLIGGIIGGMLGYNPKEDLMAQYDLEKKHSKSVHILKSHGGKVNKEGIVNKNSESKIPALEWVDMSGLSYSKGEDFFEKCDDLGIKYESVHFWPALLNKGYVLPGNVKKEDPLGKNFSLIKDKIDVKKLVNGDDIQKDFFKILHENIQWVFLEEPKEQEVEKEDLEITFSDTESEAFVDKILQNNINLEGIIGIDYSVGLQESDGFSDKIINKNNPGYKSWKTRIQKFVQEKLDACSEKEDVENLKAYKEEILKELESNLLKKNEENSGYTTTNLWDKIMRTIGEWLSKGVRDNEWEDISKNFPVKEYAAFVNEKNEEFLAEEKKRINGLEDWSAEKMYGKLQYADTIYKNEEVLIFNSEKQSITIDGQEIGIKLQGTTEGGTDISPEIKYIAVHNGHIKFQYSALEGLQKGDENIPINDKFKENLGKIINTDEDFVFTADTGSTATFTKINS